MRPTLVLLALLLLAPPAAAKARTVEVEVGTNSDGSMYLTPKDVTVQKGDEVTLRVTNVDSIFHDVALLDYAGQDIEIEVPAKRTETKTFTATEAGDFRLICEVVGHKQKGMQGTLHVTEEKAAPGPALPLVALALVAVALAARRRDG